MLELPSVPGGTSITLWSRDFLHPTAFSARGGQGKACAGCMGAWCFPAAIRLRPLLPSRVAMAATPAACLAAGWVLKIASVKEAYDHMHQLRQLVEGAGAWAGMKPGPGLLCTRKLAQQAMLL